MEDIGYLPTCQETLRNQRVIRETACCLVFVAPLLWALCLLGAVSFAFAAAVDNQVELKATHPSGIPLHQEPRGTKDFQLIPDGTRARVIDVANDGQWLKLSLRYIRSSAPGSPSPGTSPAPRRSQRIEEGMVQRVADGDTVTVITANRPGKGRGFRERPMKARAPIASGWALVRTTGDL